MPDRSSYDAINEALLKVYESGNNPDNVVAVLRDGSTYTEEQLQESMVVGGGKIAMNKALKWSDQILTDVIEPAIDKMYLKMFNRYWGNVPAFDQVGFSEKIQPEKSINLYYFTPPAALEDEDGTEVVRKVRKARPNAEPVKFNKGTRHRTIWQLNIGATENRDTINQIFTRLSEELKSNYVIIRNINNVPKTVDYENEKSDWSTITTGRMFGSPGKTKEGGVSSRKHTIWSAFEDHPDFKGDGWFRVGIIQLMRIGEDQNHIKIIYGRRASAWKHGNLNPVILPDPILGK